jgi:hypothetical protein
MIAEYGATSGLRLKQSEQRVLASYMAAIPLYHAVTAGLPLHSLTGHRSALPHVNLSAWLLDHPDVPLDVVHAR